MGIALKVAQRTQKQSTMTSLDIGFDFFYAVKVICGFRTVRLPSLQKKTDLMPG